MVFLKVAYCPKVVNYSVSKAFYLAILINHYNVFITNSYANLLPYMWRAFIVQEKKSPNVAT